jgi:type I restriction enzyme S subunit
VTKLGKLFEKVDVCQTRLSRISILLKRFRQSILAAAADGRLTSDLRHKGSAEWEEKALGEVLTAIEAGKSFACEERPPHGSHEIGVLKVSAVSWGIFDENESKTCLDPAMVRKEYFVHKGDLLLSRANTIELVGAVAIVSKLTKRLMLSDKTLRLKVKGVSPEWVLYCLRSDSGRGQIESLATGNQQSMRNIGQGSIRAIRIPIPPEDEQREIVRRVEALFNMADRIEARFTKACAQIDKLTPSLLAKAFRGELVPTEADLAEVEGRAFESATQLLARIKSSSKPDSRNGIDPHRIRGSGARLGR